MLLYAASERQRRHATAELITTIALAYGGCQGKDGAKALQRALDALNRD